MNSSSVFWDFLLLWIPWQINSSLSYLSQGSPLTKLVLCKQLVEFVQRSLPTAAPLLKPEPQ